MSKVSNEILSNCKNYIGSACLAAQASLPVLMKFFKHKKINVITHSDLETRIVEIPFKTATLTCVIDSNQISTGAFLFFNNSSDILHFIDYCNKNYTYDFFMQNWQANNCFIKVHTVNKECSLAILPIVTEQISKN